MASSLGDMSIRVLGRSHASIDLEETLTVLIDENGCAGKTGCIGISTTFSGIGTNGTGGTGETGYLGISMTYHTETINGKNKN
jgi:hypothetical protein